MPTVEQLGLAAGSRVKWKDDPHELEWRISHFYSKLDWDTNQYKEWAVLDGPYGARVAARPTRLEKMR